MKPLVSAIIPVYNGAAFIEQALSSVFAQDYEPLEVIVADDGSTDDTATIARSFDDVTVLALSRGGVSRARNQAVDASRGEFLAFLDADDSWYPGKTSAQLELLESHPGAGFALCLQKHDFDGPVPGWFRGPTDDTPVAAFEPSAWLVRRATLEAVGGFDESRSLGEDTHWLSRAWDLGVRHVTSPEVLVRRRIHGSNATGTIPSQRDILLNILRESIGRKRLRSEVTE